MKKIYFLFISIIFSIKVNAQCTPPSTFAVGPYYIPCGFPTAVISAGTNSTTNTYSYSWNGPAGAGISCLAGPSCYTTMVNMPGTYTVTITNTLTGCLATNTMSVIQSTVLSVFLSGTDSICLASSGYVSASVYPFSPPSSYTWSTGSNLSSINVTPTVTSVYSVTAYNSAYGCAGQASFTITVIACTGVKEFIKDVNVVVFPNPGSEKFNVNLTGEIEKAILKIYDNTGREILKQILTKEANEINVRHLTKGMYYYTVTQDSHLFSNGKVLIE